MGQHVKTLISSSSSKSDQSKYSMHKGSMSVPRKRKIKKSSSGDQAKKRRAIRSGAEAQSRQSSLDNERTRLSERQQIALALEESKRTAAAERVHKHQASKKAAKGSDSDDASDSEQDSVSEDESAVKEHRRAIKAEQPADSLVSQHSDVASQLGKHKHQLCARNGRLESLSGGSKQSHSSSQARQAVASQPHTLTPELQRVESDAESHPGHAHSHNGAATSSKQQRSPERQRTSDVSSRDVLEAVDELVKVKDESQSQELAVVRLPLKEDGMDLVNVRTQRLALRQASSQMLQSSASIPLPRLDKLKHNKADAAQLDGVSASPQHPFGKLKVRTKREDSLKHNHHIASAESPVLDGFQSSKTKGGVPTPRQLEHRNTDLTPQFPSLYKHQHGMSEATPRSWHLQQRQSAPMAELVESDLFGDLTPSTSGLEARPSAPVISPRLQLQLSSHPFAALPHKSQHPSESALPKSLSLHKAGVKVTLKQHRLAVTDGCKPSVEEQPSAALAVQPATPAIQVPAAEQIRCDADDRPQPATQQQSDQQQQLLQSEGQPEVQLESAPLVLAKKRKPLKQGRGRPSLSFLRAVGDEASLRTPTAEPAEKMRPSDATMQTADALAVPETDAKASEPSAPAARSRGRVPKPPKRAATLTAIGRRASRTMTADGDMLKNALSTESRGRQKGFSLLAACSLLTAHEAAWDEATQRCPLATADTRPDSDAQPSTDVSNLDNTSVANDLALRDAAASALLELKQRHLLEGDVVTGSMAAASEAADKSNSRWQSPNSRSRRDSNASEARDLASDAQPSLRSISLHMWAPYQMNRDCDQLFASRKWTQEELTSQDPRSPRRTASHRTYDSAWDNLQARQNCELQTLDSFKNWCDK